MKIFDFQKLQKTFVLPLLLGIILFTGMFPILTEAMITVTGSGPVEPIYQNNSHESDYPTSLSHPLCHGNNCHVVIAQPTAHPVCHGPSCTTTTTRPVYHTTTYNCNTNTWKCEVASCDTGQYSSLSSCQANCKAPVTKYSCNTNTWQCVVDSSGPYTSLSNCQADCKAPVTRYSCNTNTWQCVVDSSGPYTSLSNCQNNCQPSVSSLNVSCYASPSSGQINQTITFYSNVSGGSGNYSYYWSGVGTGYQSYFQRSFSNSGTQIAYLTVYDSQGRSASTSCNAYISGNTCPNPPTINLWADQYSINQGEKTYIRWSSNNANYCVASNGWEGNKSTNGLQEVSPSSNTSYTLTCYGYSNCGSVSKSITIYTTEPSTNLNLTKLGRNLSAGARVYSKVIQVLENDTIEFYLTVKAGNNADLRNVVVKDPLPSILTYIPGTTKVDGIIKPDTIHTTGLSLGTIARGTSKVITFQAKSGYAGTYLNYTNTAEATATNQDKVTDSATITYGLVAGAATVKTGVGGSLLISFIISSFLAFAIWYYLSFNPQGKLALATIERKARDSYLNYSRQQIAKQNK